MPQLLKEENVFIRAVHQVFLPRKLFFVVHQILMFPFCPGQLFLVIFNRGLKLLNRILKTPLGEKIVTIEKHHPYHEKTNGN